MGRTCRVKTDSSPPLCGVHEVRLVLCDDLLNADAPYLGRVHCLRCPVSKKTILKANGFVYDRWQMFWCDIHSFFAGFLLCIRCHSASRRCTLS